MVLNAIDGDKGLRQAIAVLRALVDAISPAMRKAVKKWADQNPQLENILQAAGDAEDAGVTLLERWEHDRFRIIQTNQPRSGPGGGRHTDTHGTRLSPPTQRTRGIWPWGSARGAPGS
jgi:hypothetical protein